MITPKDKDKVLNAIIIRYEEAGEHEFMTDYENLFPDQDINYPDYCIILEQFKEKRLLSDIVPITKHIKRIIVSANLFDFYNHGGFVVQEEILQRNLEKLNYELMKLAKEVNPGLSESIGKITEIAASVATALGFFSG